MKPAYLLPLLFVACGPSKAIGLPAGANNFDDPDDPGQSGQNSSGPDASGDASGRSCTAARDCPAAFVCAYPIADACGASGRCLPYDTTTCGLRRFACACDNTPVQLCAPDGFSPKPISSMIPCAIVDAGSDASDAASE